MQILLVVDKLEATHAHPLSLLADETKKLLKTDSSTFMPILRQWHPQAAIVSASLAHKLYGQKLVSLCPGGWSLRFIFQNYGLLT